MRTAAVGRLAGGSPAAPSRPSGCSGSSATGSRCGPRSRRRPRPRSGRNPFGSVSGSAGDVAAGVARAPLGDRVARAWSRCTRSFPPCGVEERLREVEDRLLRAEGGQDVGVGIEPGAEAPLDPARRSPRGARAARRRAGTTRSVRSASFRASRMNAGVSSRGSPTPKSTIGRPAAIASAFRRSSSSNGYGAELRIPGERCTIYVSLRPLSFRARPPGTRAARRGTARARRPRRARRPCERTAGRRVRSSPRRRRPGRTRRRASRPASGPTGRSPAARSRSTRGFPTGTGPGGALPTISTAAAGCVEELSEPSLGLLGCLRGGVSDVHARRGARRHDVRREAALDRR